VLARTVIAKSSWICRRLRHGSALSAGAAASR
jgi:hypothetical protein